MVSTHSRPKAAVGIIAPIILKSRCFTTQPPEGGWFYFDRKNFRIVVSTHSRPKAAEKIQNNP